MTTAEFRRLALSLPGAEEREHMDHPDFRVEGKIFATLGYPDSSYGMVKLFPDQQAAYVASDPKTFNPVKGAWGRQGCTSVWLKTAGKAPVQEALAAAWEKAAKKTPEKPAGRPRPAKKRRA